MNIEFNDYTVPIITLACLGVGYVLKKWMPTDNKYIPTILAILGAISGIIVCGFTYEGIAKGMISGLASVGLHQAFHQFLKINTFGELTEEEANVMIENMKEGADE